MVSCRLCQRNTQRLSIGWQRARRLRVLLFLRRFLVLIGHLRQLVCNAPVAVDAGQARFEPFGHRFCRSFGLLVRVHGFGRVTVAAFV